MVNYNSPVNKAGRAYRDEVKSYRNDEIETIDDVYERLDVIDAHFHSTTFDKMSDADKREVTRSDMETLFGDPHEVVEDVDMYNADTVYQYTYDDITINFHERFRTIDEFVVEDYTEAFYDAGTLEELFIESIRNQHAHYEKTDEAFEPITEEKVAELILDETPTRTVQQSGWTTWRLNRRDYFDDGSGDYSPTEFLAFKFDTDDETTLFSMQRRYQEPFLKKDTPEEYAQKRKALNAFPSIWDKEAWDQLEEKPTIAEFTDAFGEAAHIHYIFPRGNILMSWVMYDGEFHKEVTATAPIADIGRLAAIEDLQELEVIEIREDLLSITDSVLHADAFIGSR